MWTLNRPHSLRHLKAPSQLGYLFDRKFLGAGPFCYFAVQDVLISCDNKCGGLLLLLRYSLFFGAGPLAFPSAAWHRAVINAWIGTNFDDVVVTHRVDVSSHVGVVFRWNQSRQCILVVLMVIGR